MAPKNAPPAAKAAKIVEWFRDSMGVYTLKELEKVLPKVGAINGMQVKDYIQHLMDENQIRCEKIGSGNWYWSFRSDAKKSKEKVLNGLQTEESKLVASITEAERQIEEEMAKREQDDEMLDEGGFDRTALVETHKALLKELEDLNKELAHYSDSDPSAVESKLRQTEGLMGATRGWTSNIEELQCYFRSLGSDRGEIEVLMQQCCGDEYVLGDGLKNLDERS